MHHVEMRDGGVTLHTLGFALKFIQRNFTCVSIDTEYLQKQQVILVEKKCVYVSKCNVTQC